MSLQVQHQTDIFSAGYTLEKLYINYAFYIRIFSEYSVSRRGSPEHHPLHAVRDIWFLPDTLPWAGSQPVPDDGHLHRTAARHRHLLQSHHLWNFTKNWPKTRWVTSAQQYLRLIRYELYAVITTFRWFNLSNLVVRNASGWLSLWQ